MKRWTALGQASEEKRWRYLSKCLADAGAPNEYSAFTDTGGALENLDALKDFDHVRMSTRLSPFLLKHVKVQSSWITLLGVTDGMTKAHGEWWPLCALYESFGELLIELGTNLDKHGSVLIVGAGGTARTAIAAFFKAGFRNYMVTNLDGKEAEAMVKEVRAKFFGLKVEHVPTERIVLLPGESSVVINTTPPTDDNALLIELSYLNFLKRPGTIFETARTANPSLLVREAQDAGVSVIAGPEIAARSDVIWAKWAFQTELDLESYRAGLLASAFT